MATEHSTEVQQELERMTALRGFRYGMHEFLASVGGLEALDEHNLENSYHKPQHFLLDDKTRELLKIVARCVGGSHESQIRIHMHAAVKAGATPEEILEAIMCVKHNIGATSSNAFEAWRIHFRPDLPTVLRVVELR